MELGTDDVASGEGSEEVEPAGDHKHTQEDGGMVVDDDQQEDSEGTEGVRGRATSTNSRTRSKRTARASPSPVTHRPPKKKKAASDKEATYEGEDRVSASHSSSFISF